MEKIAILLLAIVFYKERWTAFLVPHAAIDGIGHYYLDEIFGGHDFALVSRRVGG